jgi:hypothetical protein
VGIQVVVKGYLGVTRKGQMGGSLLGVHSGKDRVNHDKRRAMQRIAAEFSRHPAANFVFQVAAGMRAHAHVGILGDKHEKRRVRAFRIRVNWNPTNCPVERHAGSLRLALVFI